MLCSRVFLFAKSLIIALAILDGCLSFQTSTTFTNRALHSNNAHIPPRLRQPPSSTTPALHVLNTKEDTDGKTSSESASSSAEDTTEKFGLEAGLFQSLKSNDGESAKSLLAKYGVAYLATSIPLAIVSFALCYALVDNGVDVGSLLTKVGIEAGDTGEKAGTFAIAYAAHKAASPIRFPPTVLLTPVVAKLIGKEPNAATEEGGEE
mmetsp:Transcript_34117/g.82497  ORF Transcript_34117/g.82497 Transcript_34117/m.82497 type:complete len:207 (-) Transcript_34117:1-621(-)|eukprot:CAMPEP_0181093750 /NCGR_PEP_ID=MMETSP1071-20121207/9619_1 /TAXON_ID=35127 /ORGANISM="Thalassiosira sp., Strain NH16" /LENGTH=206 /DNA_ID=CAMNT_0023176019 /DNA_START=57 /DNA_END=677 /DNA_ORIENTATION=-